MSVSVAGEIESAVLSTCSTIGRPATGCSTLGNRDFMRVPWPAARMTMWMSADIESGAVHEHRCIAEGGPDRKRNGSARVILLYDQFSHALDRGVDLFWRSPILLGHLNDCGPPRAHADI